MVVYAGDNILDDTKCGSLLWLAWLERRQLIIKYSCSRPAMVDEEAVLAEEA